MPAPSGVVPEYFCPLETLAVRQLSVKTKQELFTVFCVNSFNVCLPFKMQMLVVYLFLSMPKCSHRFSFLSSSAFFFFFVYLSGFLFVLHFFLCFFFPMTDSLSLVSENMSWTKSKSGFLAPFILFSVTSCFSLPLFISFFVSYNDSFVAWFGSWLLLNWLV